MATQGHQQRALAAPAARTLDVPESPHAVAPEPPAPSGGHSAPGTPEEPRSPNRLAVMFTGRGLIATTIATDALMLLLAVGAALVGAKAAHIQLGGSGIVWVFPPLVIGFLALRGMYRSKITLTILDEAAHVVGATSVAAMVVVAIATFLGGTTHSAELLARVWVFGMVYVSGGRLVLGLSQRYARQQKVVGKRTLIVGAGRIGAQVERRLDEQPELGLRPVGYVDAHPPSDDQVAGRHVPVLGGPDELDRIVRETGAEHVVLAFLSSRGSDAKLVPIVRQCDELGLEVSLVPRLFESINVRMTLEHIGGMPLFRLRTVRPKGWQFAVKHALDRVVAAMLIVILSPVLLASALGVRLSSPGPIFFRQRRVGRDGRDFDLLKFRSMRLSDGPRPDNVSVLVPGDTGAGRRRGRGPPHAGRLAAAPLLARRAAAAVQRPARRHEHRRPASRAAELCPPVRGPLLPLRRPPSREVRPHRLGAGPRPARPDLPVGPRRVGQLLHRELVAVARRQDPGDDGRRGLPRGRVAGAAPAGG